MTIWVKKEIVAKRPEFRHVGFVSSEKHCSEVFFRLIALSFRELTYAKNLAFPGNIFVFTCLLNRKQANGLLVGLFFKMVEPTESRKSFASLPYIKGVTEPLTRVLKKHDVTVANKPFTTLQQQFPAPKFRPLMVSQTRVVYKMPCTNCSWCYFGETGRAFNIHKGTFRTRKTLHVEAWHTKVTPNADNNSCLLPGQYITMFFLTNIHDIFCILFRNSCFLLASGSESAYYSLQSVGFKIVDLPSPMRSSYPGACGLGDVCSRFLHIWGMLVNACGNIYIAFEPQP